MIRSISLPPSRRALGAFVLFGSLAVLAGCGEKPKGSVTGKVAYKGEAVNSGTINFYAPDKGLGFDAKLDGSGGYSIEKMEVGSYKVYISPPLPEQLPPGEAPKKKPFSVPKKFQDPNVSPLTFEVKAGKNDYTPEIKD